MRIGPIHALGHSIVSIGEAFARYAADVANASGKQILTTPDSAVRKLRRLLEA